MNRLSLVLLTFLALSNITWGQNLVHFEGTKILLEIPNDFFKSEKISGYESDKDSSSIKVSEMAVPIQIEDWFIYQVGVLVQQGFNILDQKESKYNGYRALQLTVKIPDSELEEFIILFGKDNMQVAIISSYTKERKEELKNVILKGKYDSSIKLDPYKLIGFKVSSNQTFLKEVSASAFNLRFEERDDNNELMSYLYLVRSDKANFEGINPKVVYDYFANKYFPTAEQIANEVINVSSYSSDLITYKSQIIHGIDYNFLTIIYCDNFDIIVVGLVTDINKIQKIKDLITSLTLL